MKKFFSLFAVLFMAATWASAGTQYLAQITIDGSTTQYADAASFRKAVNDIKSGNMSIKLLSDCSLDGEDNMDLQFWTATTFDLNGHTLTGWLHIIEQTIINDSSEGKTGKLLAPEGSFAMWIDATTTINGGTFEAEDDVVYIDCYGNVTLNGGTYNVTKESSRVFCFITGGQMIIADGYEYTDGKQNSVSGTLNVWSNYVTFVGSVVRSAFAQTTINGVTTRHNDEKKFMNAVYDAQSGEMSIKLLSDCDLGNDGKNSLVFQTTTTFDLNGHTLTGSLDIRAQATINDSGKDGAGKVKTLADRCPLSCSADVTVNGGTFEGSCSLFIGKSATATLYGGIFNSLDQLGAFHISEGGKAVIPVGYEYTDGKGHSVKGTLTDKSDHVMFAGSIMERAPLAQTTIGGVTTQYNDEAMFRTAVKGTRSGEISVKLLSDCDLGGEGMMDLEFQTKATLDLNGHTLKGWLDIEAPTTINDSSEGKTGKVVTSSVSAAVLVNANTTINGGEFEGGTCLDVFATVNFNGGTCRSEENLAIKLMTGSQLVIPAGYVYSDGKGQSVSGTLTHDDVAVTFSGSIVKTPIAEITKNGSTEQYADVDIFRAQLTLSREGDVSARLLADCDLGDEGRNALVFNAPTTFDLNGYTLTGGLEINAPATINDSSEGKTGKVMANSSVIAITADADVTVNGGTYDGTAAVKVNAGATVTLNGCTINVAERAVFIILKGGKIVIPDGYEYTDGEGYSVDGTLTFSSALVEFAGSVVKTETPTAIDNIGAQNTQKTVKTIENGEIVIIKGGERFNLRGAKIK